MAIIRLTTDTGTLARASYWRIVHIGIDPLRTGMATVTWGAWVDAEARAKLALPLITRTRQVPVANYTQLLNDISAALYADLITDPFFADARNA